MAQRSDAVSAALSDLHGRTVSWFRLDGGKHRGAIGVAEGEALERAVRLGIELGVPVVGAVATSGADVGEGVESLHAAGRVARALSEASGVVPTLLAVVGPCVSGPALVLGLVDHVVMTTDAFAYVTGPETVTAFTGVPVSASIEPACAEKTSGMSNCDEFRLRRTAMTTTTGSKAATAPLTLISAVSSATRLIVLYPAAS